MIDQLFFPNPYYLESECWEDLECNRCDDIILNHITRRRPDAASVIVVGIVFDIIGLF